MITSHVDWLLLFRGIAITEMLVILSLLFKQRSTHLVPILSQLFVVTLICYLFSDAVRPATIHEQPPAAWYGLIAIALNIPLLYWLLARTVFIDEFHWGKKEWLVLGIYELGSLTFLSLDYAWNFKLQNEHVGFMFVPLSLQTLLSLWTLYIIVNSWRIDLMESRRRLRWIAALAIGGYTLFGLGFELSGVTDTRSEATLLIHTVIIAVLGFVALVVLGQLNITGLYLAEPETDAPPESTGEPPNNAVPEEQELVSNWNQYLDRIRAERLYALENMTIAKLASLLDIPEYRLRKQIVHSMKFRNFNQFLNHFRIEEAANRLVSEKEFKLPILSIALDVGFRSLPSFNRSFKETYQVTPSEYRKNFNVIANSASHKA